MSGRPLLRPPVATDTVILSAVRSVVPTGILNPCDNGVLLTLVTPVDLDWRQLVCRITRVADSRGNTIWDFAPGGAAPSAYGALSATCGDGTVRENVLTAVDGTDGQYEITYFPPDLVLQSFDVTITVFGSNAGQEFRLGSASISIQPPSSPLSVVLTATPNSITVNGSSVATRTTALKAVILGGVPIVGDSSGTAPYRVRWLRNNVEIASADAPAVPTDEDGDGVADTILSSRAVTASVDLLGPQVYQVNAVDANGNEASDSVVVTVNSALSVLASLSPPTFTGTEAGLRATLSATAGGGTGSYSYKWTCTPTIAGLFDDGVSEHPDEKQQVFFPVSRLGGTAATFKVTVTDSANNAATASVERGFPPGGGGISLSASILNSPACALVGEAFSLQGGASGGVPPYVYNWSSVGGGVLATPNAQNTTWTAPAGPGPCQVNLLVTDSVGTVANYAGTIFNTVQPVVAFASAGSATANEAAGNHTVTVTLSLPGCTGEATPNVITVQLTDTGLGSATAGADYTALGGPVVVTFPAGSVHGAMQAVNLGILGDLLVEGPETIALALAAPTGGAALGLQVAHAVTITDDDVATVAFAAAASATANEIAGNHAVTVALSVPGGGTTAVPMTVQVTDAGGGTATSGPDYAAVGTVTLTFPAGSANGATQTFNLSVLADALVEGDETVNLQLGGLSGPAALGATLTHAVTITDDDAAMVQFTVAASATANEVAGNFSVTATLTIPGGGTTAVPITVQVTDALTGTATSGVDYGAVGVVPRTFPIGSGNGAPLTFNLQVLHDVLVEGNETVDLQLGGLVGPATLGAQTTHTATITDDDVATVAFAVAASATANEAAVNHPVTVTLTLPGGGATTVPISLNVTDAATGTAVSGADYAPVGAIPVTFPAGSVSGDSANINVGVLADLLAEGNETVDVQVGGFVGPASLGAPAVHTVTITDDDGATVAFASPTSATADESAGPHPVSVRLTLGGGGVTAAAITVMVLDAGGGTATSGTDYAAVVPVLLTFPAGSVDGAVQMFNLGVNADLLVEGAETVNLSLGPIVGPAVAGTQTTHQVTITDDDAATVQFAAATSATANEAAGNFAVTVTLTIPGGGTTTVPIKVDVTDALTGTAATGVDYGNVGTVPLTFPIGSGSGATLTFSLQVMGDLLAEGNETVNLQIGGLTGPATLGAQTAHTVTITDDDVATVAFAAAASATANEAAANHPVAVTLTLPGGGATAVQISVNVSDAGGGSATSGADYTAPGVIPVVFPAGSANGATQNVNLAVLADATVEGNETVNLQLGGLVGPASLGAPAAHTVTITDDDVATVAFAAAASATADESAGNHPVSVRLTLGGGGTTMTAITVVVSDAGSGTATSGTDYTAVGAPVLTFPAGSADGATQTLNLGVKSDHLVEGNETVGLSLGAITGPAVAGLQTTHQVTITDDDPATVAFTVAASATASEAALNHVVNVKLSMAGGSTLAQAVTVNVQVTGGTALAGADYTDPGVVPLTFPTGSANNATLTYSLGVLSDALHEANETVILGLSVASGPASAGAIAGHTITITDDDAAPNVTLSQVGSPMLEAGTTSATVTATLGAVSGLDVTVDLAFSGTAVSPADYTRSGAQIVVPAGSLSGSITLTAVDDALHEGTETVTVDISGVTDGVESGVQQVTVNITDNDAAPNVTLSQVGSPMLELGTTSATVTATLDAVSGLDVTVDLAFSGTATFPGDYTRSGAQIVVPAGSLSGSITLTAVDDALVELPPPNETVIVDISGVTEGVESGVQQVTVEIASDE